MNLLIDSHYRKRHSLQLPDRATSSPIRTCLIKQISDLILYLRIIPTHWPDVLLKAM